ncbi:uncharacterized protein LACBIDRAFT_301452 [Laccaria bicolor S238N-H82]|uniref:Predicted protein n=1 Tax=Laccaria bicolor (strain S238N-H82 / ATCC MYA-4686) TaxID=486041 RepID=B0CNK4_LACBS|nr:uncharacterized protein LACBIDRAFT_301452 [Laccaria bicolor S238N-H82]EDR15325.1 predicted protein [Laccaria bicolor S238N-H82]|eukprot:XP_001873533.1 predicted protein [Laccaria bicolor S238N-H82]
MQEIKSGNGPAVKAARQARFLVMPLNVLGRRYSDASTFWFLGGAHSRRRKVASVHMTFRRNSYVHSEGLGRL